MPRAKKGANISRAANCARDSGGFMVASSPCDRSFPIQYEFNVGRTKATETVTPALIE